MSNSQKNSTCQLCSYYAHYFAIILKNEHTSNEVPYNETRNGTCIKCSKKQTARSDIHERVFWLSTLRLSTAFTTTAISLSARRVRRTLRFFDNSDCDGSQRRLNSQMAAGCFTL